MRNRYPEISVIVSQGDPAPVQFGNAFHNGQSQTASGAFLSGRAEKAFFQTGQVFCSNDSIAVGYGKSFVFEFDADLCFFRTVTNGIIQQVTEQQSPEQSLSASCRCTAVG